MRKLLGSVRQETLRNQHEDILRKREFGKRLGNVVSMFLDTRDVYIYIYRERESECVISHTRIYVYVHIKGGLKQQYGHILNRSFYKGGGVWQLH